MCPLLSFGVAAALPGHRRHTSTSVWYSSQCPPGTPTCTTLSNTYNMYSASLQTLAVSKELSNVTDQPTIRPRRAVVVTLPSSVTQ
ncbi:hypothetical protein E2C01_093901 [Portunus trituberculatus]|uniref:Uncharacterized protein n=1 Tax=Portunus trituberculatus TaxID=210409 RepID=A0A5B7JZZ9_PORTR|nr:hypothetical protein [Portunus trituberculatus]